MKKNIATILLFIIAFQFAKTNIHEDYNTLNNAFNTEVIQLKKQLLSIHENINPDKIDSARIQLKKIDFLLRYLHEVEYKKINGVMPVEWETEVYEKWKTPYKREGGGLFLAYENYSENNTEQAKQDIIKAAEALDYFLKNDTVQNLLKKPSTLVFANRLFLLNCATIYNTGFENPNPKNIIPELKFQMEYMKTWYSMYNQSFEEKYHYKQNYLSLYEECVQFLSAQSEDFTKFNHFIFIQKFINPLFAWNQQMLTEHGFASEVLIDFTMNNHSKSIFDKSLFWAQKTNGAYNLPMSQDEETQLKELGKTLFYDPILSANNERSCASCHSPQHLFQDGKKTALHFDTTQRLSRNSPTLCNVIFQHLLHIDGKHQNTLQQAAGVITNANEMNANESEILKKINSIPFYKKSFQKLSKCSSKKDFSLQHIGSALTFYYSDFSYFRSDFDEMMDNKKNADNNVVAGFNIFMSKAQCATCHFLPQFSGVKPPFLTSEFEVLGVPETPDFKAISKDEGRHNIFAKKETKNAFRTPTLRNVMKTAPYMHNGVFGNIDEVIDFYNKGGGIQHNYEVNNQTLSRDSLQLNTSEIQQLKAFLNALNENIPIQIPPSSLPLSKNKSLNERKVGGVY